MNFKEETEKKDISRVNEYLRILPEYVKDYIVHIRTTTTPKTRLEYVKDIKFFLDYVSNEIFSDEMQTNEITTEVLNTLKKKDFDRYFDYLQYYKRDGKTYSNSETSIKRKLSAIKGFMTYLYEENLLDENAITKVKNPKLRHKEIIYMDQDETYDFLNVVESGGNDKVKLTPKQEQYHKIQSTRDLAICYLMLSTGIRVSECVGLNMNDVDFKKSSLHIIRKGDKEAYVYFSDEAADYLMDYIEQRRHIETRDGHEEALFLSSRKSRITDRSVENIIKKYAKRSVPMKHITPHKLRSTFATQLYEKTGDIYLVADDLGHESIQTTKRYSQLTNKRKREHRNMLNFRNPNEEGFTKTEN